MTTTLIKQSGEIARTLLPPGRWAIDPAHTAVSFEVRHLGLVNVKGTFNRFAGVLELAEDPERSRAEGVVDVASIDTRVDQRDAHLRSPDFFDVARFAQITFSATSIEPLDAPRLRVTGQLMLLGVTRELVLEGELHGPAQTPIGERIGLRLAGTLDRARFGMGFATGPDPFASIGSDVHVELDIEAVPAPRER